MEYLIFGISLGLFIVGLIAALLGFLSRREQPTGHLGWCRSCRHPVRAETSHCSECGGDLSGPKAVRSTLPRVRRCLVTAGVLGILLGLGGISGERVAALQGFDWNTVKPVWWLELQAAGGTGVNTENVRKELVRRYMDGELTSGQATDCARASLDRFITRKPWGSPGDATLLEYAWLDDFLSDDEMKKFFQSNWDRYAEVKIRDRVRIGQAIPFRLQLLETGLPWNISARRMPHAISIQASFKAVRDVEGEDLLQSSMGSTTFGGWFLGGLPSSYGTSFALPLSEGMNHLAVEVDFTLILSPGTSFLTGKDIGGERFTWTHVYPVSLNAAPDDQPVVNAVAVEAFQETLREAVHADHLVRSHPARPPAANE
jgi:hypothetical protein